MHEYCGGKMHTYSYTVLLLIFASKYRFRLFENLYEKQVMKPRMYLIILLSVLFLAGALSCAKKEIDEPASALKEVAEPGTQEETNPIIEQATKGAPNNKTVIEQITAEPEEDTAVTYPRPVKIKSYKSSSTDDSWFLVGGVTGERAYSIFVDPQTIETKKDLVTSWSKLKFEETERDTDGLSYKEVLINSSVDCERRTYSYTDSKFYDALERLVENQVVPYDPQPIIANTVSAKIADFVCGYQLNRPE